MTAAGAAAAPAAATAARRRSTFRFRAPRRTVRLRLTLLYVGLFLASAACLLVITYFLVAQQLPATLTLRTSGGGTAGTSGTLITGGNSVATACTPSPGTRRPPSR